MLRKDSVRLTRRFDRIERGLHAREADRRRAELRAFFGFVPLRPPSSSLVFPPQPAPPPASPAAEPVKQP